MRAIVALFSDTVSPTHPGGLTKRAPTWWWPTLVVTVALLSWLPAILTVFPPMAGYLYVPLGMEGFFPYRDFYMPVTPLTYMLAQLSDALGDVRIVYMAGSLVLPPILALSIYSLTRAVASVQVSAILACFGSVSLITFRADIAGGWNSLVVVFTTMCAALFVRSLSLDGARTVALAVLGGIVGGLATLSKQTAVVPLAFGFITLSILSIVPGFRRSSLRIAASLCGALIGFGVVIGGFAWWLVVHHAWGAFIQDMSSFGGKNPSTWSALSHVWASLRHFYLAPTTAAALLAVALWQVMVNYGVARLSREAFLLAWGSCSSRA